MHVLFNDISLFDKKDNILTEVVGDSSIKAIRTRYGMVWEAIQIADEVLYPLEYW